MLTHSVEAILPESSDISGKVVVGSPSKRGEYLSIFCDSIKLILAVHKAKSLLTSFPYLST
jgi:hypothetical protein